MGIRLWYHLHIYICFSIAVDTAMPPEFLLSESKKGNMCFSKWDTAMLQSIILSPGAQEVTQAVHLWFIPPSAIQMFPINRDHQWFNLSVFFQMFHWQKKKKKKELGWMHKVHFEAYTVQVIDLSSIKWGHILDELHDQIHFSVLNPSICIAKRPWNSFLDILLSPSCKI